MNIKGVSGVTLLIIPLLLTGTIGVYFNNFNNNGFQTPAVAGFSGCPTLLQWNNNNPTQEICQAYNQTYIAPCQSSSNATYCGFQKASVLNSNSLYTCIFTVSWQCFVNGITGANNGPTPQPFQFFNQPQSPIYNICLNINGTAPSDSSAGPNTAGMLLSCDEVDQNSVRVQANQSIEYTSQYNCTNLTHTFGFGAINYVYFGCNFIPSHTVPYPPVNSSWSAIEAFNGSLFGAGIGWSACTNVGHIPIHACDILGSALVYNKNSSDTTPTFDWLGCNFALANENVANSTVPTAACKAAYTANQQENGASGSSLFFFSQILAMIGGIVLTFIGFGLGFSGGALTFNFSITPNSQGTRYAQILGFVLLAIVPFNVEFAGPYTVLSVLGIGTVILSLFTLLEFLGITFLVAQPQSG